VAERADILLPYHASPKAIPQVDANGQTRTSKQPNGLKLERFVFDALPAAHIVSVVETLRESEYAPVKNAEGSDSPATSRSALVALYRRWLETAGVALPPGCRALEIDHSRVDGPEDARSLGVSRAEMARDAILIEVGGGG
jgi:UDP-N-acetylglucosamine pyrophosphorylase